MFITNCSLNVALLIYQLVLDIADETNNQFIKEVFRRSAADEQNHAVWFLYYLT